MTVDIAPPADVSRTGAVHPPNGGRRGRRPGWMHGNVGYAAALGVGGYALGHFLGNLIASGYVRIGTSAQNDPAIVLGLLIGVLGWLLGVGALNYPLAKLVGIDLPEPEDPSNWTKYFRYSTTHKTVGVQYLIGVMVFLFTAGLVAMAIRTELLSPTTHLIGPGTYISLVGEHGTLMMMMASSLILGPFGNWLVPIMIGSRRMALPRIEGISFWLFCTGYLTFVTTFALGGFPTGWTGYAPLQTSANEGMDSYLVGFMIIGIAMILAGFNIVVTVISCRAPGMTWGRIPIFVWSMIATGALMALAAPFLVLACAAGILDRTVATEFFVNTHGGSSYLWEDIFWFFGHPEVYIMALPGFGIVGDIFPVFCKKPLFAYKVAAAAMLGVGLLSWFVWQHHIFQSGINPDMRPLFMLTTEMISIPTSFVYLVGLGTLYKAKIKFSVPMLFALAVYFNFLLGGASGIFVSDVPVNVTVHGSFFVMAHFHYTILGGLVFAFMAGVYFWVPKMTGYMMNKTLGLIHFWTFFISFNLTFFTLFLIGIFDQPRRVFEYATRLTVLNDFASICAYIVGASFFIFAVNFVWSVYIARVPAPPNPWGALSLEWQVPSPVPSYNFRRIPVVFNDPYHYSEPNAVPVANFDPTPEEFLAASLAMDPGGDGKGAAGGAAAPLAGALSGPGTGDGGGGGYGGSGGVLSGSGPTVSTAPEFTGGSESD